MLGILSCAKYNMLVSASSSCTLDHLFPLVTEQIAIGMLNSVLHTKASAIKCINVDICHLQTLNRNIYVFTLTNGMKAKRLFSYS